MPRLAKRDAWTERFTCPPMRRTRTRRSTRRFSYRRNPEASSTTKRLNSRCPLRFNQDETVFETHAFVLHLCHRPPAAGARQGVFPRPCQGNEAVFEHALSRGSHALQPALGENKKLGCKKLQRARPCCRMSRAYALQTSLP